jgi:hypothetical protein
VGHYRNAPARWKVGFTSPCQPFCVSPIIAIPRSFLPIPARRGAS